MMDPNDALEQALRELSDGLPGELVHLRVTCNSQTFQAKRCFAKFRTEVGPLSFEIPLEPGFDMARWVRENLPPTITKH